LEDKVGKLNQKKRGKKKRKRTKPKTTPIPRAPARTKKKGKEEWKERDQGLPCHGHRGGRRGVKSTNSCCGKKTEEKPD